MLDGFQSFRLLGRHGTGTWIAARFSVFEQTVCLPETLLARASSQCGAWHLSIHLCNARCGLHHQPRSSIMALRFLTPLSSFSRGSQLGDPLLDLHREVNQLFEDMFSSGFLANPGARRGLGAMPRLDVRETEQELCVAAELPGVKSADVDLRLDGDVLTISGEKKTERDEQNESVHLTERSYGRFERTVQLPFAPDPEQVRAEFEDGVLNVHLQKRPDVQRSRRIEVQESSRARQQTLGQGDGESTHPDASRQGEMQPGAGQVGTENMQTAH
jgi:HSP20 family protein